jgi:membrane protease YdiL (CAAX protease family)
MPPGAMPPFFTPAFDAFVAPARLRPQIWRLIVGGVVIFVIYVASVLALLGLHYLARGANETAILIGRLLNAVTPFPTLFLLATFGGLVLGVALAGRLVQRRPAASLFGRAPRVLRDFVLAAACVAVVYAVLLTPWLFVWEAEPNLDPWLWLRLLPLSVALVLLQTLAEELVFRGYLLQGLAARFRQPLVWFLLPALCFGLLHYDPRVNGANTWAVIAVVTLFGLIAADLTRRTGSIGAAWGLHFGNNSVALLVLATQGAIPGLALYRTPYAAADPTVAGMMLGDVLAMLAVWLLVVRLTAR